MSLWQRWRRRPLGKPTDAQNSVSLEILLVGHMLHPIYNFAVELFLYGNVSHGSRRSGTMPVLFTGSKPNDIPWMNVLDGATFQLQPTSARRHDQGLTKGMGVPRCACARLKSDTCAGDERWVRRLKQWIDAYGAGEPIGRSLAGCLRSHSFDFQVLHSSFLRFIDSKTLGGIVDVYVLRGSSFTVAERLRWLIIGER